jgi:hypothetical protein
VVRFLVDHGAKIDDRWVQCLALVHASHLGDTRMLQYWIQTIGACPDEAFVSLLSTLAIAPTKYRTNRAVEDSLVFLISMGASFEQAIVSEDALVLSLETMGQTGNEAARNCVGTIGLALQKRRRQREHMIQSILGPHFSTRDLAPIIVDYFQCPIDTAHLSPSKSINSTS